MRTKQKEMHMYDVVVGNVGTVFSGTSKREALLTFKIYCDHSKYGTSGRCYGENVTLFYSNEILKEYIGSLEVTQDNETID